MEKDYIWAISNQVISENPNNHLGIGELCVCTILTLRRSGTRVIWEMRIEKYLCNTNLSKSEPIKSSTNTHKTDAISICLLSSPFNWVQHGMMSFSAFQIRKICSWIHLMTSILRSSNHHSSPVSSCNYKRNNLFFTTFNLQFSLLMKSDICRGTVKSHLS